VAGLIVLGVWVAVGCQEEITATLDGDLIPVEAVTVEVTIPFDDFARDLEGWGGYGRPHELIRDIVARSFQGSLDARVLNGLNPYPAFATVKDSTGVFVADSALTFVGSKLVVRFDTLSSVHDGPVELAVSALQRDWDYRSVAWDVAVDSVGDRQVWDEPGGGPAIPLGTGTWDPSESDSVVIAIDSASAALMADTASAEMGVRLDAVTEGVRLDLNVFAYYLIARPSVNPDTLVDLSVPNKWRSFIYDPAPAPPEDEIRVGGVPAWRSVFTVEIPDSVDVSPEVCSGSFGVQCRVKLTAESLISASLVLTSKAPPLAFQPADSLYMDVRPVLEPSRLPKSPLGSSLVGSFGVLLPPEDFTGEAGAEIEIPLGPYVEGVLQEKADPELDIPKTLALLSLFEPLSLYFGAFEGPDSPNGPKLRLILTFADEVGIR
jgi:hypothetical protein